MDTQQITFTTTLAILEPDGLPKTCCADLPSVAIDTTSATSEPKQLRKTYRAALQPAAIQFLKRLPWRKR